MEKSIDSHAAEHEHHDFESAETDDPYQQQSSRSRKRRMLTCFECNRPEGHFLVAGRRWFFSYLLGLTFGGILLIGPYKCQCCGANRLMYFDELNPRYWLRTFDQRKVLKAKRRRSRN